ncbi:MAG: uracil phosphoribosyltransferase [Spirochaetaceae bacterium]|jgi:uracil phosphoribosyltransferase|nr:uracil phosphoribosyltransferase [Spirochaetaceae bacterium]
MNKIILKAQDLDGFLTDDDKSALSGMDKIFADAMEEMRNFSPANEAKLISLYNKMGDYMQEICNARPGIHVYPFETPHESHAEASRVIAKLRDSKTDHEEFVYYTQRAYELLFKLAYGGAKGPDKNYLIVKTPVTSPVQNYAVHKIGNVDNKIENSCMCVMLRGALLPSMIMSKEIQEYSSHGYVTPFALFRIKRDESKNENNMEYILDLDRSFFNLEQLNGKDWIFADPMNATGGSLVTVVKYLLDQGIKPRSVQFFNVIAALKGALRVIRALNSFGVEGHVYTVWMDPALNHAAYIMPGLGDAGDRINGRDTEEYPRNIIQLIADYGSNIAGLYRAQLREIENTVL